MKAAAFALIGALGMLQACSLVNAPRPAVEAPPERWLAASGTGPVERSWWIGFGDPVLTSLIDEALARNLDLREARARVMEARALTDAQRGAALPALDLALGTQRSRSIQPAKGIPFDATVGQAQFLASYEVDLWGRIDSLIAAAEANADAAAASRDFVALSVSASVASGYFNLLSLDAQLELTRETLVSRERSLELNRSREASGYGGTLETAQAEAELRATSQVIPQLEMAMERQERALNVLLARNPGPIARGKPLNALALRELPGAGLPSELLRRRPDIANAEFRLAAADARFNADRDRMLPSVRLTGAFGSFASSALIGNPFTLWSLGGSILAPIFNGGELRALAEASASRRDQALIDYERAVLTSFAEVESQLTTHLKLREETVEVEAQRRAVAEALRIAHNRYREGYSSYLEELLAQRNLFNVDQNLLQLQAQLLATEVNLYRALGGGWERSDFPERTGRDAREIARSYVSAKRTGTE